MAADLPELSPENLLGEPEGRDSLNAVAWPAAVLAHRDPEAIIAQLTADQLIDPVDAFVAALEEAFSLAEADDRALVTLGVIPTTPHTGYGYLHRGAAVPGFPPPAGSRVPGEAGRADRCRLLGFRASSGGTRGCSCGGPAPSWPRSGAGTRHLCGGGGTGRAPQLLAGELFGTLRKTSVDFAIMEPVSRGATDAHVDAVALPIRWRDVGGFAGLAEVLTADGEGNVVDGDGVLLDAEGNPGHQHGAWARRHAVPGSATWWWCTPWTPRW